MRDLAQRFRATFADQFRRGLVTAGIRSIDLAVALGVSESQVSKWRNGVQLPNQNHLPGIELELGLTTAAAEDLHAAWQRETHLLPAHLSPPSERPDTLIADLMSVTKMVNSLRQTGQARIALQLASRERERALLRSGRFNLTEPTRKEILRRTSALLVEQCKAALDFMSRREVEEGALAEDLLLLREIADLCQDTETRFAPVLTLEAATYVSGDVTSSLRQTQELLLQTIRIPEQWMVEVLRAAAINAGKAGEGESLTDVQRRIETYLAAHRGDVNDVQVAFLLEGLARGMAAIDAGQADEIMQRAWAASGAEGETGGGSALRYVQLVRTDAEISVGSGRRPSPLLGRRVASALRVCREQGYDRYIDQLAVLERRIGGEAARR